ncbi:MAG: hypothetical protein QUU85_18660 [Candidatus Eisenbacteria bacterium]|nr:hypothetical protein [Candidatus Eisenbacteria bacterium]
MERGKVLELPQLLADRLGWQKLVEDLDRVVAALPASQRGHAAIAASNYGEASAVNILGARRGMPPAISGHNSYWLWGPGRDDSVSTWVAIGDSREDLQVFFAEVQPAGSFECGLCVEDGAPIWIARAPLLPLREAWGAAKHFE